MNLPDWLGWAGPYIDLAQQNAQHVAVGAGIVGALIAARTIHRYAKTREHDELAANLGVLLFLVVTTEGMWEVVYHKLDVAWPLAVAMFAAYDTVIYGERAAALKALARDREARIVGHLAVIWGLSIAASITVSFASGNTATWFFRFFSPLVGAALATQKILAKRGDGTKRQESSWIWTPTRLMIRWGWLKPGAADDLSEVFAARRIAALVDAGLTLHAEQQAAQARQGEPVAPSRRRMRRQRDPLADARRRMQRLTQSASAEDVTAARVQLRRVLTIEVELFRDDSQPTQRERELMDELRLVMRQATTKLRAEGAAAFASVREPMVELGGIRMPAHIAAQIGPMPEPYPAHSGGALEALVEVVGESGVEAIRPTAAEPVREPGSDSPRATAATHRPAQRRITERLTKPAQGADDRRIRQAHTRLTRRLGREPSGAELGEAAGVSKATANRWKSNQ